MNRILFDAILSMDAYNRGYNPAIKFGDLPNGESLTLGEQLGSATIIADSRLLVDDSLSREDQPSSFYALAYEVNGETIISYRGTDSTADVSAYSIGLGNTGSAQARLAFAFYNEVASIQNGNVSIDPRLADISVTGHSLGGGLAGLVGSVYNKSGALYDNMAFEAAAQNTQFSPFPNYTQAVYRNLTPWAATIVPNDPDGPIITYSLDGEFLGYLNRGFQQTYELPYELPGDPNLDPYSPDLLELHSISALAIHIFSETEISTQTQWHAASPHFWPVLFQDDFAQSLGFSNSAELTSILAYSAIDEGPDEARPFGDTAIRSFYNDANDLGAAITLAGAGSAVETYATEISQVFIDLAAQQALLDVEIADLANPVATTGVLWGNDWMTFGPNTDWASGDRSLTVSLSENIWAGRTGQAAADVTIASRDALVDKIIEDTGQRADILANMNALWGTSDYAVIGGVTFSTDDAKPVDVDSFDSSKATIYVGDDDAEVVYATTNGLVLTHAGSDTVYAQSNNIVDLGQGNDIYIRNQSGFNSSGVNIVRGGDGYDVADYSLVASRINVVPDVYGYRVYNSIDQSRGYDLLIGFEKIIGTTSRDIFEFGSFDITFEDIGGNDEYKLNPGISDVGDTVRTPNMIIDQFGVNTIIGADTYEPTTLALIEASQTDPSVLTDTIGRINSGGGITIHGFDPTWPVIDLYYNTIQYMEGDVTRPYYDDYPGNTAQVGGLISYYLEQGEPSPSWGIFAGNHVASAAPEAFVGSTTVSDTVDYSPSANAISISLQTGLGTGGDAQGDTFTSIEHIIGTNDTANGDQLYGNADGNELYGLDGDDLLVGEAGDDVLKGGRGDDVLRAGQGDDLVDGGVGFDTAEFEGSYTGYVLTEQESHWQISDTVGTDGTDFLYGVEALLFDDGTFDTQTRTFTPSTANAAPIAQDDSFVGDQGLALSGNVLGNDSDPDGDPISVTPQTLTTAQGGNVDILANGDFTYTPPTGFSGSDGFSYSIIDSGDLSDTANVTLQINPAPGPQLPRLADAVINLEGTAIPTGLADSTAINTGTYIQKTHAVAFETGADVTSRQVIYEQGGGTRGLNMFLENGKLYAAVWNKAEENWGYKELEADVSANGRYTAVFSMDGVLPANGNVALTLNGGLVDSGTGVGQLYTHGDNIGIGSVNGGTVFHNSSSSSQSNFTGSIEKLVQYNTLLDSAETSQLNEYLADNWLPDTPINTAPIAVDDSFIGDEDSDITGNVLANDTDPDGDALSVVPDTLTTAQGGAVVLLASGDFTYTPAADFFGSDGFVYSVQDGRGGSDAATVSLVVNEVIEPPPTTEAPTTHLALLEDGGVSFGSRPDDAEVNLSSTTQKTHAISFETGADVSSRQVLYEQGGATRGLNFFIENGKLYSALWNKAEENWGYQELSYDIAPNTKYTTTLVVEGSLPSNGYATLYVDGAAVQSALGIGNLYPHGDDIAIGQIAGSTLIGNARVDTGASFTGSIEKIAHYNGTLSSAEFDQLQAYLSEGWLTASPAPTPSEIVIMEFGTIDADHTGASVSLTHSFNDPVVFVTMTSFNDSDVAVPRITDIQSDGFSLYAQEAEYLDGIHGLETFSYIVVEKGSWVLSDGTKLEAGTHDTSTLSRNGFDSVGFASSFDATPAVFTQVQSNNDPVFVATRQDNSGVSGFDLALTEEEQTNTGSHAQETIGWFAIEQGAGSDDGHEFFSAVGTDSFTHNWQDIMFDDHLDQLPQLLASVSTHDGGDASFVRVDALSQNSARVQVDEDQSSDTETNHTSERIDVFAVEGSGVLTGLSDTETLL